MRVETDDELYRVNAVWLGPTGRTLPWRASYAAYFVGAVVFLVSLTLLRQVHIDVGFWVLVYTVLGTVGITTGLMRIVDYDRPLHSVPLIFWHELTAPRMRHAGVRVVWRPSSIRLRARRIGSTANRAKPRPQQPSGETQRG